MVSNKNANEKAEQKLQKFKWKCIKFEKNLIEIQIMFDNPSYVSYEGADTIIIEVTDHEFFQVQDDNRRMLTEEIVDLYLPSRYTMVDTFPKQFHDKETAKAMQTLVKGSKDAVSKSFIFTVGTNILLIGSIALIWGLINTLQMILYLPISQIGFPANVSMLYNILLPLASLDVIPPQVSTNLIFHFSDNKDKPYNKRLKEMGYGNHNAIENIGSVVYFMTLTILLLIVSLILSIPVFNCGCCLTIKSKFGIIGLLASLYMLFFESFLEILISSYLSYL